MVDLEFSYFWQNEVIAITGLVSVAADLLFCHYRPSGCCHGPSVLPLQALCPLPLALLPRSFCPATTGLRADVGKGRACPPRWLDGELLLLVRAECPVQRRRARWSFPSYSPESLSRHSTIGSRNRRQISSLELLEVTFVVQEGYFAGPVLPEGTLVARRLTLCVPYHRKSLS